jgi:hypothetical protein
LFLGMFPTCRPEANADPAGAQKQLNPSKQWSFR